MTTEALVTDEAELKQLREEALVKFSDKPAADDPASLDDPLLSPPDVGENDEEGNSGKPYSDPFPHRHYKSFHPVCNLLLAWKWDQTQKAKHLKKITQTKTAMRIAPPKAYQHLHVKLKKIQMEEDRLKEIQRDNKILLERMAHVIKSENKTLKANRGKEKRYIQSLKVMSSIREQRLTEKINKENEAMLQRIEARKPQYDHLKWLEDRYTQITYLQNISAFPKKYIDLRDKMDRILGIAEGLSGEPSTSQSQEISPDESPKKKNTPKGISPKTSSPGASTTLAAEKKVSKPKKKAPLPAIDDASKKSASKSATSSKKMERESSPIAANPKKKEAGYVSDF